ncbi:MAG: Sensor protein kinase WalK, partial [Actinomycetota bacterium]
ELISTHSDDIARRRSFTIDVDTSNEKKILEISAAPLDGPLHGNVLVIRDITSALSLLEMKTRFISIVSHEIRTPLTSLAGSLDLLDAGVVGVLPTQAAELVNVAQESTSRLVRLVNDVLDLDRLESQRVDLTLGEQTSDTLIAEVFRTLQPQASRKRVRLVAEPAPDTFVADHDRIVQVLLNLIQNALKFSPPSSTIVVASLRVKNEIQFVVDDEGRGIPADALDGIFEPFAQVETSDDRRNSGTGLGLAISRGIIHRHGGRIWAENRSPVGSRFIFTLPLLPKEP